MGGARAATHADFLIVRNNNIKIPTYRVSYIIGTSIDQLYVRLDSMKMKGKVVLVVLVLLCVLVDCCEANGGENSDSFIIYSRSKLDAELTSHVV